MKRLLYRNVVTSYNVRPLYWSCDTHRRSCAPDARHGILLGYLKKNAEPDMLPLYWACVSAPVLPDGECADQALVTQPTPYGGALLGYISRQPRAGMLPLYWNCENHSRSALCATSSPGGNRAPLGYVYDKSIIKGTCSLEMRVYKKDVNATGLAPLLAFHGGGWRYRGGAFVGFEAQLAHYTEDGFVVFVPFYRLAGNADGNGNCNEAPWNAITSDAEAALDWVIRYAAAFGARREPPAVMGQSAGAHLAGWLLTHRPAEVSAGLLLYAPSDFRDFLAQTVPAEGIYHEHFAPSLRILSRFFGSDVRTIDLTADTRFVRLNSFHDYVRAGGVPPVFMIHGKADITVPSNQSVLLCNAYGGSAQDHGGGIQRRATFACDGRSRLHLFQQGGHGLDGCLRKGSIDACAAGDEQSRQLIVDSLREARAWLKSQVDEAR
jgi:acetyl esterase/lipase